MIGLDTNILLRAFMDDDAIQSPIARARLSALTAAQPGYVGLVVLTELTMSLRRRFKAKPDAILLVVETLLRNAVLVMEAREQVTEAVELARLSRAGFNDALIGLSNRHAGCIETITFDHGAPLETGFTLLT